MKKTLRNSRKLPKDIVVPEQKASFRALMEAKAAVLDLLYEMEGTISSDEIRERLTGDGLDAVAVDWSLVHLVADRCLAGSPTKGWRLSKLFHMFEATVCGSYDDSGMYVALPDGSSIAYLRGKRRCPVVAGDTVLVAPVGLPDTEEGFPTVLIVRVTSRMQGEIEGVCTAPGILEVLEEGGAHAARFRIADYRDEYLNKLIRANIIPHRGAYAAEVISATARPGLYEALYVAPEQKLRHEFDKRTLEQAAKLPDEVTEADWDELRRDLRGVHFVTIDGEDARDFDDAVYCEQTDDGWRLMVAIADVSHYVRPGDALDVEAQMRGTSVYFPQSVLPMLPEKLSNGLCSLNPGVDRCAMVCDMLINGRGEVRKYSFYPAMIHSHARLTYTKVFAAMNGDADAYLACGARLEDLENLVALYWTLAGARKLRGALDFESEELRFVFDEKGRVTDIARRESNDAHRLIEECMLAANICAADFMRTRGLTGLYRVHEPPSAEKLSTLRAILKGYKLRLGGKDKPSAKDFAEVTRSLAGKPYSSVVQKMMLQSMQRAVYSPINVGHYGLGYEAYTHFTSPIRRYPDLLVHRVIRASLLGRKYEPEVMFDLTDLMSCEVAQTMRQKGLSKRMRMAKASIAERDDYGAWSQIGWICSINERRADAASRKVENVMRCRFAATLPKRGFAGTITGLASFGVFVTLDRYAVEGMVHVSKLSDSYVEYAEDVHALVSYSGQSFRIGDKIDVIIDDVDLEAGKVSMSVVKKQKQGRGRRTFDVDPSWFY